MRGGRLHPIATNAQASELLHGSCMALAASTVNGPDAPPFGRTIPAMLANARNLTTAWATRSTLRVAVVAVAMIALGTLIIAVLEQVTEIPDASAVYLVAVVVVGSLGGTVPAVVTAVASFLVYDLLFTEPRFSLTVADSSELLNLVLVLIVALAVGRLAALGRERAAEADRRAIEATGQFAVSRLLATADSTEAVAGADRRADRPRCRLSSESGSCSMAAPGSGSWPTRATDRRQPPRSSPRSSERPATNRHAGSAPTSRLPQATRCAAERPRRPHPGHDRDRRERLRDRSGRSSRLAPRSPDPETTRLLSLAADQLALGLRRDRLRGEATSAEIARRSDALKSALLDSVSHDLRTPLASIRATAGNLADPDVAWSSDEVRRAAETIDAEAQAPRPIRPLGARPQPDRIRRPAPRPRGVRPARAAGADRGSTPAGARRPSHHDRPRAGSPARSGRCRLLRCDRRQHPRQHRRSHAARALPWRSAPVRASPVASASRSRTAVPASRRRTSSTSSTSSGGRADRARVPAAGWASGSRSCRAWPSRSTGAPLLAARISAGWPSISTSRPPRNRRVEEAMA